jgi:hypothetical protein
MWTHAGLKWTTQVGCTLDCMCLKDDCCVTEQGVTEQGACCRSCNVKTNFCFKGLRVKPAGKLA